uniref:Uncharacterized protein n=1 Tax=Iconisemion striatum TaxID=60296 RepID=A0A1A7XKR7_9TELE
MVMSYKVATAALGHTDRGETAEHRHHRILRPPPAGQVGPVSCPRTQQHPPLPGTGIDPTTIQLLDNPLYLPSYCCPYGASSRGRTNPAWMMKNVLHQSGSGPEAGGQQLRVTPRTLEMFAFKLGA